MQTGVFMFQFIDLQFFFLCFYGICASYVFMDFVRTLGSWDRLHKVLDPWQYSEITVMVKVLSQKGTPHPWVTCYSWEQAKEAEWQLAMGLTMRPWDYESILYPSILNLIHNFVLDLCNTVSISYNKHQF